MNKNRKSTIKQKLEKSGNRKRWADIEVKQLLKYLQEQPDFEKPTAQIFYSKFLKTSGIDATWSLVRWKMKNMKNNFYKAETWRKSSQAKLLEAKEGALAVKDKLKGMCRFYDDLHCILGRNRSESSFPMFDSGTTSNMSVNTGSTEGEKLNDGNFESINENFVIKEENEYFDFQTFSLKPLLSSTTFRPSSQLQEPHKVEGAEYEYINTNDNNSPNHPSSVQYDTRTFLQLRLEFEKVKFKKEFKLKESQFAEEIQERKENFELKKLEMEKDERLRRLELKIQERIERFEIEMRYNDLRSHDLRE